MEEKLERLKEEAESAGFYININKTKEMTVNTSNTQKLKKSDHLYTWEVWSQRKEKRRKSK
jgi:hypothetical protein